MLGASLRNFPVHRRCAGKFRTPRNALLHFSDSVSTKSARSPPLESLRGAVREIRYTGIAWFALSSTELSSLSCDACRAWKNFSATCGNSA
jgi:hypothetical protein